jgi:thiamine biosynthesis protein ThiS
VEIVVNGEKREVPEGITVDALLKLLGIEPVRVAVERNMDILAKGSFADTALEAGDKIEIIQFVGGGAPL